MTPFLNFKNRLFATHQIRELPIVVLMPYGGCNCRCIMCDYWKGASVGRELDLDVIARQMESFRQLRVQWVLLSGGEPLMHTDLWDICGLLEQLEVRITLLSNGLLLPDNADNIQRFCTEVIVSLDGTETRHDKIRGVSGAFEQLVAGVEALKRLDTDMRVTARCTIQKSNYTLLPDIIDVARAIGLDGVSFLAIDVASQAFHRQNAWNTREWEPFILDTDELEEFKRLLSEVARTHRKDFATGYIAESPEKLKRLYRYFAAVRGDGKFPPITCNAPWISAVIESNGLVRPCFFHQSYGTILENPLERILNSPEAIAFRENLDVKKDLVCRRCVCPLYRR
jgi:MoaA/NifB/PqqE/SkfB family radical SAM enzyme